MKVDENKKKKSKKNKKNKKRQELLTEKNRLLKSITFVFIIAIVVVLCFIIFFKNRSYIKTYENDYIEFKYDDIWELNKEKSDRISFTHKTNSFIDIKISNLSSSFINSNIENISDEVRYDIEKQNSNYKLLKEEKKEISKNKYEAYKLLYEDGDSQSLVIMIKKDNYLCVINYTSNNENFDILLDSFQYILGSLNLK